MDPGQSSSDYVGSAEMRSAAQEALELASRRMARLAYFTSTYRTTPRHREIHSGFASVPQCLACSVVVKIV